MGAQTHLLEAGVSEYLGSFGNRGKSLRTVAGVKNTFVARGIGHRRKGEAETTGMGALAM